MLKQPVVKELSTALGTRKYQVKTKAEGKFLSLSDVISNIKSSDNYKLENPVDIALTEENLLRALRYSQNPSLEPEFTEDMYKAIQLQILNKIEVSKKISDSLIDLSNILSLSKGLKPTFAENFTIERALKNIGLEIKLRDKGNPENLSDYIITHTNDYNKNAKNYPFDFLDLVKEDKILKTYLQMYLELSQMNILNHL
jgi:hypothetical protein